ncbi:MAG: DUF1573 domain-containing protein [Chitinophagaceae bacterium]
MKKVVLLATVLFLGVAVMAQTKVEDVTKFSAETHNFGKIKHNVPVTYFFEFKNISDKPLVVENAYATCGCTVPERPEKPIMPGETGKLKVQFNAAAVGPINKEIYVKFAGVEQNKTLKITGEVLPD